MTTDLSKLKSVLKKLSALRATLSTEEQELLDTLLLYPGREEDEVDAHLLDDQTKVTRGEGVKITRSDSQKATLTGELDEGEVEGHLLDDQTKITRGDSVKITRGDSVKITRATEPDDDEVQGHLLDDQTKITRGEGVKITRADSVKITFNAEDGEYQVKIS